MIGVAERLAQEIELTRKVMAAVSYDVRCAEPGIIQSFDASRGTVVVQLAIREKVIIDGVETWETIKPLVDVPLMVPRGGGFLVSVPVKAGDECLVVFADACIDAWWQSSGVQNQIDRRRHDLSDGFAVLAPWSQPTKPSSYSTTAIQVRNEAGTNFIELSPTSLTLNFGGTSIVLTAATIVMVAAGSVISLNGINMVTHHHTDPQGGNTGGPVT